MDLRVDALYGMRLEGDGVEVDCSGRKRKMRRQRLPRCRRVPPRSPCRTRKGKASGSNGRGHELLRTLRI